MEGLLSTGPTTSSLKNTTVVAAQMRFNLRFMEEKILMLQVFKKKKIFGDCILNLDWVGPVDNRPSTAEAPPIGKINPFSKITVTLEQVMQFGCPSRY